MDVIVDSQKGTSRMQLMEKPELKKTTLHSTLKVKDKDICCFHIFTSVVNDPQLVHNDGFL